MGHCADRECTKLARVRSGFACCRSGNDLGVIPLHVGGVQSFRPLLALELDGLAFVEALIAVFLNRGEVDEDIFSSRALNEAITLGPVEPLHDTVFPHCDSFMTASLIELPLKTPRAAICAQ